MSVSPKLREQLEVEFEQLRLLLQRHPGLMEKYQTETPSNLELDAMATILHAFYTGIENLFKRLHLEIDGAFPQGEAWHIKLLDAMASTTPFRPAVISPELRQNLRGFLDFRHVFRHAYTHELKWTKMKALVLTAKSTLQRLEEETNRFFALMNKEQ